MEIRLSILITLFLVHSGLFAQQTIIGTINDGGGKPLSNAHILDVESRNATVTDGFGKFQLAVADTGTTLRVSHIGFRPLLRAVPPLDYYTSSTIQNFNIVLNRESTLLSMVSVRPTENSVTKGKLGIVLHDFSLAEQNLLLMAEDGIRYLMVCDDNWREVSRLRVDKKGDRLYEDCFGNAHLFGEDSVYQIAVNNGQLSLAYAFEQSYFMEQLAHCATSSDSHIFFSSFDKAGQEVYHYGLHRETKDGIILQRVFDHVGLQDIKDYYANLPHQRTFNRRFRQAGSSFERERLVAMRDQLCAYSSHDFPNTGNRSYCVDNYTYNRYRTTFRNTRPPSSSFSIGSSSYSMLGTSGQYFQSVSNRMLEQQNMLNSWSLSPQSRGWMNLLSQPTYSPMFNLRDSIYVFDHVVGVAHVHNTEGEHVRSFPLEHHEHKGWQNRLIADENGDKLYAHIEQRNKIYLIEVDLNDGGLLRSAQLSNAMFVENVKVKDGYAYYLKDFQDIYKPDQMMRQKL